MTTAYVLLAGGVVIVGITALAALIVAGESAADKTALRDEVERLRSEVAKLTETVHWASEERKASQGAFPQVNLGEPGTRPLPIVRGVPTDTQPQEAVVGQVLDAITVEVAHYGRHAHREGVHA